MGKATGKVRTLDGGVRGRAKRKGRTLDGGVRGRGTGVSLVLGCGVASWSLVISSVVLLVVGSILDVVE
jgi:hypothetical protein